MTPYYKLPTKWASSNQHIIIIGPEGLVSHKLCQEVKQKHPKHKHRQISVHDKDDIAKLKNTLLSGSLFSEPEVLFIRLSEKMINNFPWDLPSTPDKILVINGIEKPPKSANLLKPFGLAIRTYLMKEPFLSKEVTTLLALEGVKLSKRGIRSLALSHFGSEYMIIPTIQRLKITFGKQPIEDNTLKSAIYNLSVVTAFDVIDALIDSPTKLHLFIQSQKKEDWPKVYWALVSYWRKLMLTSSNKSNISKHFPWESQQKQALRVIDTITTEALMTTQYKLLGLETAFKGLSNESAHMLLKAWLYQVQKTILK